MYKHTHTHTHTRFFVHLYIYIYIWITNVGQPPEMCVCVCVHKKYKLTYASFQSCGSSTRATSSEKSARKGRMEMTSPQASRTI